MKTILRTVLFVLIGLLILGLVVPVGYRLLSGVWQWGFGSVKTVNQESVCQEKEIAPVVGKEIQADTCLYDAGKLNFPTNIATYVCNGTTGDVSLQLQSGTQVPFGTYTRDNEWRVWILTGFTVPQSANYSFSYQGAERQLLKAPFVLGSELGWKDGERVPFQICYNFEGDCSLPADIVSELFPPE